MPEDLEHEITVLEEAIVKLTRQYREEIEHPHPTPESCPTPNRSQREYSLYKNRFDGYQFIR